MNVYIYILGLVGQWILKSKLQWTYIYDFICTFQKFIYAKMNTNYLNFKNFNQKEKK